MYLLKLNKFPLFLFSFRFCYCSRSFFGGDWYDVDGCSGTGCVIFVNCVTDAGCVIGTDSVINEDCITAQVVFLTT